MTENSPTFSMNIETVNLAGTTPERFARVLKSLADQDYPITNANEVILVDSGRWPAEQIREMCAPYPWIEIMRVNSGTAYGDSKMLAVPHMTGDILLFCDADVIYELNWLRQLLTTFHEHPEIEVLAGDTSVEEALRDTGVFGLAMSIVYLFPHFSDEQELEDKHHYEANNVGFRREVLLRYPGPMNLPVKRAHLFIHNVLLKRKGFTIWHQPKARAHHPVPQGLAKLTEEFWALGQDSAYVSRFFADFSGTTYLEKTRLKGRFDRLVDELRRDSTNWLRLPFALPIMFLAVLIYAVSRTYGLLHRPSKAENLREIWGDALPN